MTHGHPDHLGGARTLKERAGCIIAAPAAERHWIEAPEQQLSERPVPGFWALVEGAVATDDFHVAKNRVRRCGDDGIDSFGSRNTFRIPSENASKRMNIKERLSN